MPEPTPRQTRPVEEHSAGGVIFRRSAEGPLYLVIRDSYRNWGFPKGHVEEGESEVDAARREVGEETGLDHLVHRAPALEIDWFFRFRGQTDVSRHVGEEDIPVTVIPAQRIHPCSDFRPKLIGRGR